MNTNPVICQYTPLFIHRGITEARFCVTNHTQECAGSAIIEVANILSEIQTISDECFEPPVQNLTTCFMEYRTLVEQIVDAAGTSRVQRLCAVRQTKLICINTELSAVFAKNLEFATVLREIFTQGEAFVQQVCSATGETSGVLMQSCSCMRKFSYDCSQIFLCDSCFMLCIFVWYENL